MNYTLTPKSHGIYTFATTLRGKAISATISDMEVVDMIKNKQRGWKTAVKHLIAIVRNQHK